MASKIKNHADALSKVGAGFDFFKKAMREALAAGVSPDVIMNFLDSPEEQIAKAVMRTVLDREVMVREVEAMRELEAKDETADTIKIEPIEDEDEKRK